MNVLLHQLIQTSSKKYPQHIALEHKSQQLSYSQLNHAIADQARQLQLLSISRYDRVAIYLPKSIETVSSFFSISAIGAIFVPINPLLKAAQVAYIMQDCDVKLLITSVSRLKQLRPILDQLPSLLHILVVDEVKTELQEELVNHKISSLQLNTHSNQTYPETKTIDTDTAAILYTSGSTGKPKGVVLSHRNMVCGAESVATYLDYTREERILAVLPFSFDYGFSQLSSAFYAAARVVLMEYLLPRDVIKAVAKYQITGLAAVPPLWIQLAQLEWPDETKKCLRYITNSGGAMPIQTLTSLRESLPHTLPYLMYGLTEAFRSTYLEPKYLDSHPNSIGKAIPNAEILVLRPDGSECANHEPGELVHRGSLVAQGYWNKPDVSTAVFKPIPNNAKTHSQTNRPHLYNEELAVFSGDKVYRDEDGFLFFINRGDEMIKTSGYRVSPNEIEEVCFLFPAIQEAIAIGVPHPNLGQAIVIIAVTDETYEEKQFLMFFKQQLPNFMQPGKVIIKDSLPRNPNGKIDRKSVALELSDLFKTTN